MKSILKDIVVIVVGGVLLVGAVAGFVYLVVRFLGIDIPL